MALLIDDIRTILTGNGLVAFSTTGTVERDLIDRGMKDAIVENNYSKVNLTANTGSSKITMSRISNTAAKFNGVNIATIDHMATTGTVTAPGYVYTGDFSGCVFYLYKNGNEITGVHAYSGIVNETKTKGKFFWKKKVINKVVRESSPTDYYLRNPGTMVCRYPTSGQLDIMGGEMSLAFLACVEATKATTFLFAVKNSSEGARVTRLLDEFDATF